MPIFAANLSLQPLEPIKTEVVMPQQPPVSPSNLSKFMTAEIPSAQFDWKGSGLENPLESKFFLYLCLYLIIKKVLKYFHKFHHRFC